MDELAKEIEGMEHAQGATDAQLEALLAVFPLVPKDYIACLRLSNGVEGFVRGHGYLRLWSAQQALDFNSAYRVEEFLPDVFLFGTDAAGLGFGFSKGAVAKVISVELNAMHPDFVRDEEVGFTRFLQALSRQDVAEQEDRRPPEHLRGHVLHEKHPIALGGPSDASNRVLVPVDKHPELAVFFSRIVREVARQSSAAPS